ncbi:unnamed protein product [Schistosoma turkestanicum]|nr:unnamed protein product [Schistosoma turkestanicum]
MDTTESNRQEEEALPLPKKKSLPEEFSHPMGDDSCMKDSGIGTTYFATSSGSSSNNTSPESDKDLLLLSQNNNKTPKPLAKSKLDATSTPATEIKRYKLNRDIPKKLLLSSNIHNSSTEDTVCDNASIVSEYKISPTVHYDQQQLLNSTKTNLIHNQKSWKSNLNDPDNSMNLWTKPAKQALNTSSVKLNLCVADLIDTAGENKKAASISNVGNNKEVVSGRRRQRRMHTCERPFECKYCSKGFSTRSGVNTHERTHTGQRPYVCRVCGRRFAAGSNLIFHKYTHTNTRKHVCSQCPKAFVTPGDLRKHEYMHTGKWPYRCHLCDRGFATERNLKSHETTHSGRKPHVCSVCGKGYAQESSMKTHMRTHQKNEITTKSKKPVQSAPINPNDLFINLPSVSGATPSHSKSAETRVRKLRLANNGAELNRSVSRPLTIPYSGILSPDQANSFNISSQVTYTYQDQDHASAFSVPKERINPFSELPNPIFRQLNQSIPVNYGSVSAMSPTFPSSTIPSTFNLPENQLSQLYEKYQSFYNFYVKAMSSPASMQSHSQIMPNSLVYNIPIDFNKQNTPVMPNTCTYSADGNLLKPFHQMMSINENQFPVLSQPPSGILSQVQQNFSNINNSCNWSVNTNYNFSSLGLQNNVFYNYHGDGNSFPRLISNSIINSCSNNNTTDNNNNNNKNNSYISSHCNTTAENQHDTVALDYSNKTLSKYDTSS